MILCDPFIYLLTEFQFNLGKRFSMNSLLKIYRNCVLQIKWEFPAKYDFLYIVVHIIGLLQPVTIIVDGIGLTSCVCQV